MVGFDLGFPSNLEGLLNSNFCFRVGLGLSGKGLELTFWYRLRPPVFQKVLVMAANHGWLEYFTAGLASQLGEFQVCGEKLVRVDMLAMRYGLEERQKRTVQLGME